ncbi:helicase associated domain-containing protein [Gordonia terrae]|uniref:helicase associated domain-containing protein n=1 Tax=Gordonia terrae TaxID=2055 RepID=UPI0030B842A4
MHTYRAAHGTCNPRRLDVIDGFQIGQWVTNRQADYRKGRLPAERRSAASKPSSRTGGGPSKAAPEPTADRRVEGTDSRPVQCQFESDRGTRTHLPAGNSPVSTNAM